MILKKKEILRIFVKLNYQENNLLIQWLSFIDTIVYIDKIFKLNGFGLQL